MIGRVIIDFANNVIETWTMTGNVTRYNYNKTLETELSIMAYGWWCQQFFDEDYNLIRIVYTKGVSYVSLACSE